LRAQTRSTRHPDHPEVFPTDFRRPTDIGPSCVWPQRFIVMERWTIEGEPSLSVLQRASDFRTGEWFRQVAQACRAGAVAEKDLFSHAVRRGYFRAGERTERADKP